MIVLLQLIVVIETFIQEPITAGTGTTKISILWCSCRCRVIDTGLEFALQGFVFDFLSCFALVWVCASEGLVLGG